jgi:hypothetical protein
MSSVIYLSTAYLAPIPYYVHLARADEIRLEIYETYPKQTLRNRCLIATANGPQALTVPIEKPSHPNSPTRDIRISDHGNWRHAHWQALVSAYRMTPFFDYYADDFRPFYAERRHDYLLDYNEALRAMICDLLDLHPLILPTERYLSDVPNDFRAVFSPRPSILSSAALPPDPAASSSGLLCPTVVRPDLPHRHPSVPVVRPYYQVFGHKHGFIPHLSIVDLLFNTGPESIFYL